MMEREKGDSEKRCSVLSHDELNEEKKSLLRIFQDLTECDESLSLKFLTKGEFNLEQSLSSFFQENPKMPYISVEEGLKVGLRGEKKVYVSLTPTEYNLLFNEEKVMSHVRDSLSVRDEMNPSYLLLFASREGDLDALNHLLAIDFINPFVESGEGRNVLHFASLGGHVKIMEVLLRSGKFNEIINKKDDYGTSALRFAIYRGFPRILELLINHCKENNISLTEPVVGDQPEILWIGAFSDIVYCERKMTSCLVRILSCLHECHNGGINKGLVEFCGKNRRNDLSSMLAMSMMTLDVCRRKGLVICDSSLSSQGSQIDDGERRTGPLFGTTKFEEVGEELATMSVSLMDRRCRFCGKKAFRYCPKNCRIFLYCSKYCEKMDKEYHHERCQSNHNFFEMVVECLKEVGTLLFDGSKYESCIDSYTALIRIFEDVEKRPEKFFFFFYRGYCHEQLKMTELCLRDYSKALECDPQNVNAGICYSNRGNVYYSQCGDSVKAISDFNQAIMLKPDNLIALKNRGSAFLKINRNEESIEDFKKAIEISPDVSSHFNIGNAYMKLRKYNLALKHLNLALTFDSRDWTSYLFRARVKTLLGVDDGEILKDLVIGVKLSPRNQIWKDVFTKRKGEDFASTKFCPETLFDMDWYLNDIFDRRRSSLKSTTYDLSKYSEHRYILDLVNLSLKMGKIYEESIELKLLLPDPKILSNIRSSRRELYYERIEIMMILKKYSDALCDLELLLQENQRDILSLYYIGTINLLSGQYEEAINYHGKMIRLFEIQHDTKSRSWFNEWDFNDMLKIKLDI